MQGASVVTESLPELATEVKPQPDVIEAMLKLCELMLNVPWGRRLRFWIAVDVSVPVVEIGRPHCE